MSSNSNNDNLNTEPVYDTFNVGDYSQSPVTFQKFVESDSARAVAVIDGIRYSIEEYTYTENCHGATDTCTVVLTASDNPDWTAAFFRETSASTTLNTTILINIYAGFVSNPGAANSTDISQLQLQFAGSIDQYTIKLLGDEVHFDCRSLGAPLTTNKITTPYSGGTTTDFITAQAARFGLSVDIGNQPSTLTMQTIMKDELIAGIHNIVIWDLMLRCAVWDDRDIWVDAYGVLHYVAAYNVPNRQKLDIEWGRDLIDLEITHSPQFSKDIEVEVRSATLVKKSGQTSRITVNPLDGSQSVNTYQKTSVTQQIYGSAESITSTYTSTGGITITSGTKTGGNANSGNTQFETESKKEKYIFVRQGLTQAQCKDLSLVLWRQISQHEYSVSLTLPVTKAKLPSYPNTLITAIIRLHGTPYSMVNTSNVGYVQSFKQQSDYNFDEQQGFWPRSIEHTFSKTDGWKWKIIAINHTPPSGAV